jgi:competence protein ComEA
MNNQLKEYFNFTKKERTGIIVLLVLILTTALIPYFLSPPAVKPDRAAFERLKEQLAALETAKDSGYRETPRSVYYEPLDEASRDGITSFAFDPNTLPVEGWKRLGIRERTAITIQRYLAKGGRFRKPEDLYKIYGLKKEDCDRLLPYVQIENFEPAREVKERVFVHDSAAGGYSRPAFTKPAIVDINTADTAAFIALRGIGSKLANRIVLFREKLGGFYGVEQVGETYGLPDSTFQQIRAFLQCSATAVRAININTADVNTLKQHPYIRWPLANAIVQYRQQHGAYQSVDQLLQINIITPEVLRKISPYLAIE